MTGVTFLLYLRDVKVVNPVFIIGCPRSGTTLLFTILSSSPELWSTYKESHYVWEKFLTDKRDPMFSMYLTEADFKAGDREYIEAKYHGRTFNSALFARAVDLVFLNKIRGVTRVFFKPFLALVAWAKSLFLKTYRVLDKTPPNTYRVAYLKAAFPDAKFIYITRDGKTNVSSLIEGWRSKTNQRFNFAFRKFYDYNSRLNIKDYDGGVWKFTNPPNWEQFLDKETSLEEICAYQWSSAHKYALEAFNKMNSSDYMMVKYEDLVKSTPAMIEKICKFINVPYSGTLREMAEKPPVVSTKSKPDPNKWLKNQELIQKIMPHISDMQKQLGYEMEMLLK